MTNNNFIPEWIAAMREHRFPHCAGYLHNNGASCALGFYARIAGLSTPEQGDHNDSYIAMRVALGMEFCDRVIDLNDGDRASLEKIAGYVQEYFEVPEDCIRARQSKS